MSKTSQRKQTQFYQGVSAYIKQRLARQPHCALKVPTRQYLFGYVYAHKRLKTAERN